MISDLKKTSMGSYRPAVSVQCHPGQPCGIFSNVCYLEQKVLGGNEVQGWWGSKLKGIVEPGVGEPARATR